MRKIPVLLSGLAVVFVIVSVLAAGTKKTGPTKPESEVAELRKQVEELQSKLSVLGEKLEKLEKATNAPPTTPFILKRFTGGGLNFVPGNSAPITGNFADPNHPPKIWGEGQCNGWKYYVIPLRNDSPAK